MVEPSRRSQRLRPVQRGSYHLRPANGQNEFTRRWARSEIEMLPSKLQARRHQLTGYAWIYQLTA